MPRVRVRMNGAEGGGAVVAYEDKITKEQLIHAAKTKLITDEMERAAVKDADVILYLDGGERIDSMEEICHDDRIVVAFSGSGYKDKKRLLTSEPDTVASEPDTVARVIAPTATAVESLEAIKEALPSPIAPLATATHSQTGRSPASNLVRLNEPDLRPARPSYAQTMSLLQSMRERAGADIEIRLGGEPTEPKMEDDYNQGSDQSDADEHVPAAILRTATGWSVICRSHPSLQLVVPLAQMSTLADRLRSGEYRPAQPPSKREQVQRTPSQGSWRQRAVRRSPEEIKSSWDRIITSGIARPAGPMDNQDVYVVESQKDLFCNPCGLIVGGTGALFNEYAPRNYQPPYHTHPQVASTTDFFCAASPLARMQLQRQLDVTLRRQATS